MSKSKNMLLPTASKDKEWRWDLLVAVFIIVSVIVVFVDYLFPLTEPEKWFIRVVDLVSVSTLLCDYVKRLRLSKAKKSFMLKHWYEIPAMMPLFVTGAPEIASFEILNYIRFIALFRLIRLYNLWSYIKGGELLILATLSTISIVFGALGIYITEAENPNANIKTLNDAFWWSIETITTVAYGEYYPVTDFGKIVAGIMMFAAIGFLWTFVGLLGSTLVSRKTKGDSKKSTTVVDDTKDIIKRRIESVEELDPNELEDLIRIIRTLNSRTS
jgi:voltage-gated potassium channel